MIVDIQTETLEGAFEQLEGYISPGIDVLSARIFIGEDRTIQARAESDALAFAEAVKEIPEDAVESGRKTLSEPQLRMLTVEAFDEPGAIGIAKKSLQAGEKIRAVRLLSAGKKPALGLFGKKTAQYQIEILSKALVEISYHVNPRIVAALGMMASEPLGIQFFCYDYPSSVVDHIASFLQANFPRKVLIFGPDAQVNLSMVDLEKVVPGHYSLHVNAESRLDWLYDTMAQLRKAPDSFDIVVSNFPTHVEDNLEEEYSISNERNFRTIQFKEQKGLRPFADSEISVDLAVFWTGLSPISYLETINQLYFKKRVGGRFFHNVIAVTCEESSFLSSQDIKALRNTRDKRCYDLMPQLSRFYDQKGTAWNGGELR